MPAIIKKDSLDFLTDLSKNNNREWFNDRKDRYIEARDNIIDFADALLAEMNKHDQIETPSGKKSVYRIYKDVRFSKAKTPYNTHWSASFKGRQKTGAAAIISAVSPATQAWSPAFGDPMLMI